MEANSVLDYMLAVLRDWPDMGFAATADSIAATYLADQSQYGITNLGSNQHIGRKLFRYDKTISDADLVKEIRTINTANGRALLADSVGYVATGAGGSYMELALDPFRWLDAFKSTMSVLMERKTLGLGLGHDFDMMLAGTDYWGGGAALGSSSKVTCALAKATTEGFVFQGEQALHATCSGAGSYYRGEAIGVTPGTDVLWASLLLPVVGGVIPRFYDLDNLGYVDTSRDVTYTGQLPVYMERRFRVPDGCYRLQPEFGGSTNTSEWYHSQVFGPYDTGFRLVERLSDWIDEGFKLELVRPARYKTAIPNVTGAYAANSRYWSGDLLDGSDWQMEVQYKASHPNKLAFRETGPVQEDMGNRPLWLQASRSGDVGDPITDFNSTTQLPFNLVLAAFKYQLASAISGSDSDPIWPKRMAENEIDTAFEVVAREIPTPIVRRRGFKNVLG